MNNIVNTIKTIGHKLQLEVIEDTSRVALVNGLDKIVLSFQKDDDTAHVNFKALKQDDLFDKVLEPLAGEVKFTSLTPMVSTLCALDILTT